MKTIVLLFIFAVTLWPSVSYTQDAYEPDDSTSNASSLEVGPIGQHHTIEPLGDTDYVRFYGESGNSYVVETLNTSGVGTEVWLFHSNGTQQLGYGHANGTGAADSRIAWTCSLSGYYFVRVKDYADNQTGSYDVRVLPGSGEGAVWDASAEPNDAVSLAHLIEAGAPAQTWGIHPVGDVDYFQFDGVKGVRYTIEALNPSVIIPEMWLFDRDGVTQRGYGRSNGSGDAVSRIEWTCPQSGRYFLKVGDYNNNEIGDYSLRVLRGFDEGASWDGLDEPNDAVSNARMIGTFGAKIAQSVEPLTDVDYFRLTATEGNIYVIETTDVTGGVITEMWLYDQDGTTQRASQRGNGTGEVQTQIVWVCPLSGVYYIRIADYNNNNTGTYMLRINCAQNSAPTRPRLPTPLKGAVGVDPLTVLSWSGGDPNAGDIVTYDIYLSDEITELGGSAVSVGQTATTFSPTLSYGKCYYWRVVSHDNQGHVTEGEVWDFTTRADPSEVADVCEPNNAFGQSWPDLTAGDTVWGRISVSGDEDYFSFNAEAGQEIEARLAVPAGLNYDLYLYDSGQSQVASSTNPSGAAEQILHTAGATGVFYLRVVGATAGDFDAAAAYRLSLAGIRDRYETDGSFVQASAIVPGLEGQIHTIMPYGDVDFVSFSAQSGASYVIETLEVTGSSRTEMWLIAPNGSSQLAYAADNGTGVAVSRITWQCPATATYYIKVQDYANNEIGRYRLRVLKTGEGYTWNQEYEPDDVPSNAYEIRCDGRIYHHLFEPLLDNDYGRFEALGGRSYTIEGLNKTQANPELWLYDSNGTTQIGYGYLNGSGPVVSRINWTCPASKTCFIRAADYASNETGHYDLRILPKWDEGARWDTLGEPNDTAMQAYLYSETGSSLYLELQPKTDVDYVRFSALSGNQYAIETLNLAGYINTEFWLYGPDGTTQLGYADTGGTGNVDARLSWTCPATAQYFVRIADKNSNDIGHYEFRITASGSNLQPGRPSNVSPGDGEILTSDGADLASSAFSDPDASDTHLASQWQITSVEGDYVAPLLDTGEVGSDLVTFHVPAGTVQDQTTYFWRVRYRDSQGAWSDFSRETRFAIDLSGGNHAPLQPTNSQPGDGAVIVTEPFGLESSPFSDPDAGDSHAASQWQVRSAEDSDYSTPVFDSGEDTVNRVSVTVPAGQLLNQATYYWHVRHMDDRGAWSPYSDETEFILNLGGGNLSPLPPENLSPHDGETIGTETPTLRSSDFSDPDAGDVHTASQWQVTADSGNYASPVFDSGEDSLHLTSIGVPAGSLQDGTTYYWQVKHRDNEGAWSAYSEETSFTVDLSLAPPTVSSIQIYHQLPRIRGLDDLHLLVEGLGTSAPPAMVCADGSSATVIQVWGTFADTDASHYRFETIGSVEPGLYEILSLHAGMMTVRYTHPEELTGPEHYRTFTLRLRHLPSAEVFAEYPFWVRRAPVVLVHGLWGDPDGFARLAEDLKSNPWSRRLIYTADYRRTNAADFSSNRTVVPNAIDDHLTSLRLCGISAGKADVVGHSMGGVLARLYLRSPEYQGNVRRLVTLNTPHYGSQLANYLLGGSSGGQFARESLSLFGYDVGGGAVENLRVKSQPMADMNASLDANRVPTHAVSSTSGQPWDWFGVKVSLLMRVSARKDGYRGSSILSRFLHDVLLEESDMIVAVSSQEAGLGAVSHFHGPWHCFVSKDLDVIARVHELLDLPLNAPEFTSSGFVPGTLPYLYVPPSQGLHTGVKPTESAAEPVIHIDSPLSGETVVGGQAVTVSVSGDATITTVTMLAGYGDLLDMQETTGLPASFNCVVPIELAGSIFVGVFGETEETMVTDDIVLNVVPPSNLLGLEVMPEEQTLRIPKGTARSVSVFGTYEDGVRRDLSRVAEVTYTIDDPGIATLPEAGLVLGVEEGSTILRIGLGPHTIEVPVLVLPEGTWTLKGEAGVSMRQWMLYD